MLEIQKHILSYGEEVSFPYFKNDLFLTIKEDSEGQRVLFKYSQIDSPMGNIICQEARGLILDRSNNWGVVSWPFRKFFNLGEGHAAPMDMSTAKVLEKVDGTCITMYHWKYNWKVQTLGMIDADGQVNNIFPVMNFAELFYRTLGQDLSPVLDPQYTYTFELATPFNRIVSRYEKERIVLLSIRNIKTILEVDDESFNEMYLRIKKIAPHIEIPNKYPLSITSLSEVADLAKTLPAMDEGYVVVDKDFNRVKVKNPSYLALLHLKESSSSSVKSLVTLFLNNEGSEFLSYFPEFTDQYNRIGEAISNLRVRIADVWQQTKGIELQKDFAIAVTATKVPFSGILFNLRKGTIQSVDEGLLKVDSKHIVETLNLEVTSGKGELIEKNT